MLEKMGQFFDSRLNIYDEHQLACIDSAREFYDYTSELLPKKHGTKILDLGCGTGLELEAYFKLNPAAEITGIDLAHEMLNALKNKFPDKKLNLILGSYFDVPFGNGTFDAAVSVESLHHFTANEKLPLYVKVFNALKDNGFFVITDYFSMTDKDEISHREEFIRLRAEQGISDDEFYHYDTPLTVQHETDVLYEAGFTYVKALKQWGATSAIIAKKQEL